MSAENNGPPLASAELYDPVTNTWSSAANMSTPRTHLTASLLRNRKVLVVGGWDGSQSLASAELYDPTHNVWSAAGSLPIGRYDHTATLLQDGRVLVAGGDPTIRSADGCTGYADASAALYDPATNTWTPAASMATARMVHTATLLRNGKVLVDGGDAIAQICTGARTFAPPEMYDPGTNTWSSAGQALGREQHAATLLPNGTVLVVGGFDGVNPLASVELYDPRSNTWRAAPSLAGPRYRTTATLLRNGLVIVAGGTLGPPFGFASGLNTVELYDPRSNTWRAGPSMPVASNAFTATLLRNGNLLVAGGDNFGALASAEMYVPADPN